MKKFKIASLALTLLLAASSCSKLLEIEETDLIAGEVALQTVANTEQGVIGAYAQFGTEMDILFNAVVSDEVKVSEFYNAATIHEWQFGISDISIRDNFTAIRYYYRVIDRVNRVLQALPNADSTKAGDEALRAKVRGEALFLRAFSHFELAQYYAGNYNPTGLAMAYMETPSLEPTARITMEPYFQKINADLAEAKNLVPGTLADIARANKIAVAGLQARVALYMGDWANAITYSTEYINALPLATSAQFPGIWTDVNTNEVAFRLNRTTAAGGLTLGIYSTSYSQRLGSLFRGTSAVTNGVTTIGGVTWAPSDKIWNSYDQTNDVRFAAYFKDEPLLASAGRPSHIINKYAGGTYGSANENVAHLKVFRTGEMYLIRAEAYAESNDLVNAAADYNALRTARIANNTAAVFASRDAAITAILEERFRELAYEGHRFWDLRRKGLPVERLASDAPNANAITLPAGNFRFLLPIPQNEIDANPSIQQNPGYGG